MTTATAVTSKRKLAEIGDIIALEERMMFDLLVRSGFMAGLWVRERELRQDRSLSDNYSDSRLVVIAVNDPSLRRDIKVKDAPQAFTRFSSPHNHGHHVSTLVPLENTGDIVVQGPVFEIAQFFNDGFVLGGGEDDGLACISPDFRRGSSELVDRINSRALLAGITSQVDEARLVANQMLERALAPVTAGIRTLLQDQDRRNGMRYLTDKVRPTDPATREEDFSNRIAAGIVAKVMEADINRPLANRILPPASSIDHV